MLKYVFFGVLLLFMSCGHDPLQLREINLDEAAAGDGLEPLKPQSVAENWTEENGVFTATAPATLTLMPESGPFSLSVSLLTDQATQASISIGGATAITLPALEIRGDSTVRQGEAVLQPGIWQELELAFQPGSAGDPPLLIGAYLNGNLVYYLQSMESDISGNGPVELKLEAGSISVGNLRYSDRAGQPSTIDDDGRVVLNLPLIRYQYFILENVDKEPEWDQLTAAREGYISRFDLWAIRKQSSDFGIRFSADLDIPKAGTYKFGASTRSLAKVYIDDKEILDVDDSSESEEPLSEVTLTEGTHRLRIDYVQKGTRTRLNLWYEAPGGERTALNDMSGDREIITPMAGNVTEIELDDRPYLLRSFLYFPPGKVYDYTEKLTHVVNVGERGGPNYSYDLQSGNLLQVWRGKFVDVGKMWVERGEAQVAQPLGQVVAFENKTGWSTTLEDWTDSLTDVRHLGYDLDGAGRPTFNYGTDDETVSLTDHIAPSGSGLERTLTNAAGDMVRYTLLGSARKITERSPGSFTLSGPGVNLDIQELATGGLTVLRGDNVERLVAELPPGEHITYTINW